MPFPITGFAPSLRFIVEGDEADLVPNTVANVACELEIEIARQKKIVPGLSPELGLVLLQPVYLAISLQSVDGGF
jgi:hypothetical protein